MPFTESNVSPTHLWMCGDLWCVSMLHNRLWINFLRLLKTNQFRRRMIFIASSLHFFFLYFIFITLRLLELLVLVLVLCVCVVFCSGGWHFRQSGHIRMIDKYVYKYIDRMIYSWFMMPSTMVCISITCSWNDFYP